MKVTLSYSEVKKALKAGFVSPLNSTIKKIKKVLNMSTDYVVNYGVNFSHRTEFKIFKKYRDALAFFKMLDRETFQSAFLFKQDYAGAKGYQTAADQVEYKQFYSEIKKNDHLLYMMKDGEKF